VDEIQTYVAFSGAAAVAAAVQVFKKMVKLPPDLEDRILPLAALILGIGWNALVLSYANAADQRIVTVVLYGVLSGFAASGLWAQASATIRTFRAPDGTEPAPRG